MLDMDSQTGQMTLPVEQPTEVKDWRAEVPTVSQLTRRIRGHIENSFFDVWVKGEISNFRKPVSGHAYFLLKDATAQLRSVMFKGHLSKVKFDLKDGMEVLMHGTVTVYEARGEYQLVCDSVEPVGVGALQLAFEQLKNRLQKEGLFDPKHKKRLPFLPRRIGVVTSATGAAVRDILKVLGRRFPHLEVLILPASVQGEKAAGEIATAITNAERWNTSYPNRKLDVLIVGRGGGSLEDLWPFNEEVVARAIFNCPIPIISAVGHEIDYTIADFVADVRAPTPSAAAEIAVPRLEELQNQVAQQRTRLSVVFRKHLQQWRLHLGHLGSRLVDPRQRIQLMKETFRLLFEKLSLALQTNLRFSRKRVESTIQMLNSLSPLQVIGRGYSLSQRTDGAIIRSVKEVRVGEKMTTRISDGTLESEVLSLTPESR